MATILVVDDEQEISSAVRSILEDEGHKVEVCGDGKEALEFLNGRVPDLVISDIMMPHLSGLELLSRIRTQEQLMKVPVILMSGVHPSKNKGEATWNDFLKKPFNLDSLLHSVAKWVG